MTATAVAQAARPLLVHGLTDALREAFVPLVQKLAAEAPPAGLSERAAALTVERADMLTNALDQYAGGEPTKPADLATQRPTKADSLRMLIAPWETAAKHLGDAGRGEAPLETFATAVMQRAVASGLPQRDQAMLNNVVLLLALSTVSYWATGAATTVDPTTWAMEAVDRSGLADMMASGDHVAIDGETLRQLGPGSGVSRAGADELRTLLRLQNLHYVRKLFDAAKNGLDNAFGMRVGAG